MAINTPVQGSAADIIKLAMIRVDDALRNKGARLLLQVHDELVVEADVKKAEAIAAMMTGIMEKAVTLDVPLKVDACLLYTSPSPRDRTRSRMPSSA